MPTNYDMYDSVLLVDSVMFMNEVPLFILKKIKLILLFMIVDANQVLDWS